MDQPSRCIINVATDHYKVGQDRLVASLREHGYTGEIMLWGDNLPDGCPTHQQVPYAFKTYAMQAAARAGHNVLLWLDASMWAIKSPEPVLRHIEEHGHLFDAGWDGWLGNWTTDAFLAKHGMTRDEAMTVRMFAAGVTGLDLRRPRSVEFLDRWHGMAQDGVSFIGPWKGESEDPRYNGHRHDMSAASLLAHRMGLEIVDIGCWKYQAFVPDPPPETIFFCRGV